MKSAVTTVVIGLLVMVWPAVGHSDLADIFLTYLPMVDGGIASGIPTPARSPTPLSTAEPTQAATLTISPTSGGSVVLPGTATATPRPLPTATTISTQPPANVIVRQNEKLEVEIEVPQAVDYPHLPYDANPPAGIPPGLGITVNGLFTPDNWHTVYTQPAFYYQEFEDEVKSDSEWFYPTGEFRWLLRFTPNQPGAWHYKVVIEDASGRTESAPVPFTVLEPTGSADRGFIRVSERDSRYFEFENGDYFSALGYNLNYRQVDWVNPTLANEDNFAQTASYGINLLRVWLSQWGIYGSDGNPWKLRVDFNETGLSFDEAYGNSDVSLRLLGGWNRCVVTGWETPKVPVRRNTDYRLRVRVKITEMGPPLDPSRSHGFVMKEGSWFDCYEPGTGNLLTSHRNQITNGWTTVEGNFNSGDRDFLDLLYFALENVDEGAVWVDQIWIEEDLCNGTYGPNILQRGDMDHHMYYDQRNSYAFDKVLTLAEVHDLYFKLVLLDKLELIQNRINYAGDFVPEPEFNNDFFYGNGRQMTKVRWYQQAYLRYVQARWGYSLNIHSWEILNEGDPWNRRHYEMVDELGGYLKQFVPNDHLVSTSTWHSFPLENFWANAAYPNIDYADVHKYVTEGEDYWTDIGGQYVPDFNAVDFYDAAKVTEGISSLIGAKQQYGAEMPVIRGELGFVFPNEDRFANDEVEGVWLHNLIWGGINSGGLIESYWNAPPTGEHISPPDADYRGVYQAYANFISDVPLNNGHYQDAAAQSSTLRVWGQKDLVNQRAHLWIQNPNHTWKNVADTVTISPVTETISVAGFAPNQAFTLSWWDTSNGSVIRSETVSSGADGTIQFEVNGLRADVAIKLE